MDLIDPSGCNRFIELTVVAQDSNLAQVHTCSGDGTFTQVTFLNGHPPPFEIGAIISVWNFEKDNSLPGNKGIIIDLSGTCRWVWKSPQETTIEPVFCELFSGLGGWTRGLKAFDKESVVLVEKDATVARACAISLNLPLCHVEQVYQDLCQGIVPTSCVLVGDLGDKKVWTILSFFHIRIGCMSPPCQPWSRASRESGLAVVDGKIFACVFLMASHIGIRVLNVENVGSIVLHPHFRPLIEFAKTRGYELLHADSHEAYPFLPIKRDRWLATFIETKIVVKEYAKEWTAKVRFPIISMGPANLHRRDCLQQHFDDGEWMELQPCPDAIMKLNRKDLMPAKFPVKEGHSVFQSRLRSEFDPIGGAMAMYGRQHTLPNDLLHSKGLFTTLLKLHNSQDPPRYYSAWEFLAAMAWPHNTVLPKNKFDAWHAAGNAIAIPHTVLCIFKMHGGLQSKSPFGDIFINLRTICEKVFDSSIKLSNMVPFIDIDDHRKLMQVESLSNEHDEEPNPESGAAGDTMVKEKPIQVLPRSNPFARVHGLPQCEPDRQSHPFCKIDYGKAGRNVDETPIAKSPFIPVPVSSPYVSEPEHGIYDDMTYINTSMCPTERQCVSKTNGSDFQEIKPTQVDHEDENLDIGKPRNLHDDFQFVANEANDDKIFKKRRHVEDDTWYYDINDENRFPDAKNPAIDEVLEQVDWNDLEKTMMHSCNTTGMNRMWPMDRQVMMYCPISKWSCVTIMKHGMTTIDMIRKFLPNARTSHFHAVLVNAHPVTPQSIPPGSGRVIIVGVVVEAICHVSFGDKTVIQCKVDVTSTADDIRLQVQQQTDIKAWSIEIYHEGKKVNFWERVCHFSNPNFQAKWHTHVRMPDDIAVVVNRNQISIPPAHSDVTVAAKLSTLRFAIRHPIWTTIRTVSMPIHEKLSVVLDKIFPDLKNQMQINMTDEKGNVFIE